MGSKGLDGWPLPMKLGRLIAGPDPLVFDAEDQDGPLQVTVALSRWEALQARAPVFMDGEDRRDYAPGMFEAGAEGGDVRLEGDERVMSIA